MASSEVATRAPESDAQEDTQTKGDGEAISGIEGDTKPDQGAASMGEVTKFNDIDVYVTKPPDYPHSPSKLLLLLTGGTGVHSTNNQLQADKYAEEGFLVVMPDQFAGDPAPTTTTTAQAEEKPSIIEQVKLGVASVAKSFSIDMWLARHTPEKVLPLLQKVLASVKEEFADAVANGGGIYAVGYCFGARYVLLLGSDLHQDVAEGLRNPEAQAEEGMVTQGPQIKAGAIAHGTQIAKEDMAALKVPVCIVAVENDNLFPDEEREQGRKAMEEAKLEHEMKVYSGVPHGFAVYGDYQDDKIAQAQGEAFQQMLAWLKAH
ncbi:hypothetical protein LTR37_017829 [Vermiconidia calcicola]|uniref:Uncharacterized protein n=1 Tax=Vermiconidia calcicola TaxID=1690605 RepID=A0ACC3MIS9_9PEZI|nr:hypothetical protein LTR37_017829 [Vermiconidia calcicola]